LRERLESMGVMNATTEEAMKKATTEMAACRDQFRVDIADIEQKARGVSTALQIGVGKLYEFTDDALDKAKMVETRLQGHTASLEQVLKLAANGAQNIESKTALAVSRLESAKIAATDSAEKLEGVLQQAIDRLTERSQFAVHQAQNSLTEATTRLVEDVDQVSEKAKTVSNDMLREVSRKVHDTTAAFAYIQKQIQSLASLFDQRKGHLDEAGINASRTADHLQKSLQAALEKVREMSSALQLGITNIDSSMQKPVALLESAVSNAYLRASDMGDLLQLKTDTMTQAAGKLGENINALHDKLHGKGQDVALIAGKVATHLQTVSQELEMQNQVLDVKTQKSLENLKTLSSVQKNIVDDMGLLEEKSKTTQQIIQTLQQYHTALSEDAAKAESRLGQYSDRVVQVSGTTVDKIKSTLENLTLLEADYHRLSDASIDNIGRIGTSYRQTLETAQVETGKAAESLSSIQQQLQQQADTTRHAVLQGAVKISESATAMQNAAQSIAQSTDATVAKIGQVQEAGQVIQLGMQQMHQAAQALDERMVKGSETISIHVKSIQDSAIGLDETTRKVVGSLAEQGQALEQQTESHVTHLQRSFDHASNFTTRLRDYLSGLRNDSDHLEEKLAQSVTKLLSHGNQIDASTTALIEKITQAQSELLSHSRAVESTGDGLLQRLQTATQHIGEKASALEQAAASAQKQAEELRAQETKLKRDAFFNSTKFVVESLHSLALDFTRLLNGELDEKTWKAYQKGDTGSFTRRLLSARDEDTQTKIKTKFAEDHEFRTYVQRYLRQFEEIYDQAAANDHADLLVSVFNTSDVGKLYKFMCVILEREARGATAQQQAAA
jgi:hypothetical protein